MQSILLRNTTQQSLYTGLVRKMAETGSVDHTPGRGRKSVTSPAVDRLLKRICVQNCKATSKELKNEWREATGTDVSALTVRRRLVSMGLKAYRPPKKPLLTSPMRKARISWVKEYRR